MRDLHSITRFARCTSDDGIVSPMAFAVFRLITSSNLVGCSTGRSPGLAVRPRCKTIPASGQITARRLWLPVTVSTLLHRHCRLPNVRLHLLPEGRSDAGAKAGGSQVQALVGFGHRLSQCCS